MAESPFTPPYYAVIFISRLSDNVEGYAEMAEEMVELASTMPGFLGFESAREQRGISVSFWQDEASIEHWRQHSRHQFAQKQGFDQWYQSFELHIARVERFKRYPRVESDSH